MECKELNFFNRFLTGLPEDPIVDLYPRQVANASFSRVKPTHVANPQLVAFSQEVAEELELASSFYQGSRFAEVFVGNRLLKGMDPYAVRYGGHQFGHWAGQLGDGRAINLGEVKTSKDEYLTLQLKGAGSTPYSRTADGLAVLRSSLREFLCSEAMHHLGVPTTRALSLCLTGEEVVRDMFYDGNPRPELGAVVCRVAPSFTRFGNFEILSASGEYELLKTFVDFTIKADFPELGEPSAEVYKTWFREVCQRTARMVVEWMRVGFVHGVMNTDNMSILGLTIDYGPYGWLEGYDPDWTPNTTDSQSKRYRFGQQGEVAYWNLYQLARSLLPLFKEASILEEILNEYPKYYSDRYNEMMANKLGWACFRVEDAELLSDLEEVLTLVETDMTIFYRCLAEIEASSVESLTDRDLVGMLEEAYYDQQPLADTVILKTGDWLRRYLLRCDEDILSDVDRRVKMNSVNPLYVFRNYVAQLAIDDADRGDFSRVNELLELYRNPYNEQSGKEIYAAKRPEWARRRAGCSMLSCSS
ncbi:YdiU family protein [Puniceicoccaceae bacterium K14]|nr:YdiU family protein [Puniceicoccaceae bacterium K14]